MYIKYVENEGIRNETVKLK